MKDEMTQLLSANAKNVEQKITVNAVTSKLEETALYGEMEGGEFSGVTYVIRAFPNNRISINGAGSVRSDLDDDSLLDYIRNHLLPHLTL